MNPRDEPALSRKPHQVTEEARAQANVLLAEADEYSKLARILSNQRDELENQSEQAYIRAKLKHEQARTLLLGTTRYL